jgi:hypothetical protein
MEFYMLDYSWSLLLAHGEGVMEVGISSMYVG